jgi:hypothetical protein
MLPLVVIGATEPIRAALELYAQVGHIEHHPTAEDAHFALGESGTAPARGEHGTAWPVHVGYGPMSHGAIAVAGSQPGNGRLAHSGHTLVLGWFIDPNPGKARQVRGNTVTGIDPDTLAWQAAVALSADIVVDLAQPSAVPFLTRYLEWKSTTEGVSQS